MNKKYIFLLLIAFVNHLSICTLYENQTKLFSGSIEFPFKMEYDLCLFYNGQKLESDHTKTNNVQFSFTDIKKTHTIYFIITHAITCSTEDANTIQHLQLAKDHEYICYKLQAQRESLEHEDDLLSWKIEDYELEDRNIPKNCLVFLFDPKLIAGLSVRSWKPESVFRVVPTLIASPTATQKEINRAIAIARLAAIDIDQIHSKQAKNTPTQAVLLSTL